MKTVYLFAIHFVFGVLLISSCTFPGRNDTEGASNFSSDTIYVRQLLDSFDYFINKNEIIRSASYAKQALEIAERINYESGMADALRDLGLYYGTIGDYATDLECQFRALKINEARKNLAEVARNLSDIGIVYYSQRSYNEAVNYFNKSLSVHRNLNNSGGIATAKFLIGICFARQQNDSSALNYFFESIDIQTKLVRPKRVAECEMEVGDIYLKRKNYNDALKYYNKSYRHFEEADEPMGFALVDISLAKLFFEKSQYLPAERYARSAVEYFNNVNYASRSIDAQDILHKIYAAQNRFKEAYQSFYSLNQLRDSIQGEENRTKITNMQTAHEIEKKQSELDLVEKQIKTQRTIRNFFMAGFVIVTMLAFITFRQYKMKNLTTHKLEETLQHLKATQEQLVYTEKMSSLGTLSAGIAHEIQNPLNFVNNFSDLSAGLIDDFNSTSSEEEKKAILNDLKGNLGKINEHGKRADSIVKSMLEHTHIGSREKRPTSINNLANEFFTLAYHSFRAKEPGFTCLIEKQFDKNLPLVNINPQDISRVMINLFNNALYSLNKKRFIGNADFYPSITIESKMADGKIYFSVKDNGTGIPDELLDKIFEPFFTSKPAGEGTGLGLSISHEIVTQGHGGTLEVKNTEGLGAEFIITLPV